MKDNTYICTHTCTNKRDALVDDNNLEDSSVTSACMQKPDEQTSDSSNAKVLPESITLLTSYLMLNTLLGYTSLCSLMFLVMPSTGT